MLLLSGDSGDVSSHSCRASIPHGDLWRGAVSHKRSTFGNPAGGSKGAGKQFGDGSRFPMTPMTIGNFFNCSKIYAGKIFAKDDVAKKASRDGCFAATRSQFDLYTCFSSTRINYKVHVVLDSQKSHIYTVAVCSIYISLSLYIYIIRKMLIQRHKHEHSVDSYHTQAGCVLVTTASLALRLIT